MTNRVFRVRVGTTLSNLHYQENGVPQGSTLSVILFIIAINSITEIVRPPIHSSLFVDDFAIYCTSTNVEVIERQLQLALNGAIRRDSHSQQIKPVVFISVENTNPTETPTYF